MMTLGQLSRTNRIPGLDGIRAMAIAIVLIGHFAVRLRGNPIHTGLVFQLLGSGVVGVDLFFVLSGFLITTLLLEEYDRRDKIRIGLFYVRRAFRILPPFYAYLLVLAVLDQALAWHLPSLSLVRAGLFTFDYAFSPHPWVVAHTWSLAVEEQYYLAWPLLLYLCLRCGGRQLAVYATLLLIACATGARCYDGFFDYSRFLLRDFMMLHTRLDTLMFGSLAALLSGQRQFETCYVRFRRLWWICPLWFLVVGNIATRLWGVNFRILFGFTLNGLAMAGFIVFVSRTPSGWLGSTLNFRPVILVGKLSYGIYLWQQLFTKPTTVGWTSTLPGLLFCVAAISLLSFIALEQPALRLRNRLFKKYSSEKCCPL